MAKLQTCERLRRWRKLLGFTLKEIEAGTGIDSGNMSRLEHGKRRLAVEDLEKILNFMGIDVHTFYGKPLKKKVSWNPDDNPL